MHKWQQTTGPPRTDNARCFISREKLNGWTDSNVGLLVRYDQVVHNRFHLLLVVGELQSGQLWMASHDDSVVI